MDSSIPRTNGCYDLRIAYTDQEGLDYGYYDPFCFVAQDVLDVIRHEFPQTRDKWNFNNVFSKLDAKYKCTIDIETPEGDIPMLCITSEGYAIVHRDICKVPDDYTWMSYLPSKEIWFNIVAGTSYYTNGQSTVMPKKELSEYPSLFDAYLALHPHRNTPRPEPTPKAEKRIEIALVASLEAKGIKTQQQVRCDAGIADVVTPDTIYEVKDVITEGKLQKAVAQLIAYRACINPSAKIVVVGKQHNKPIRTNFAKHLGVEIIHWEEPPHPEIVPTDYMKHVCNDGVRCEKDQGIAVFSSLAVGDIHNIHESDDGTRLLGYCLWKQDDGSYNKELVMYPFNWQEEGYEWEGWYAYELRDGKVFTFIDWCKE